MPDWKRATFLHLDKKNEALEKLHEAEARVVQLQELYQDSLQTTYILVACALLLCVVNLYDIFKKYM